MPLQQCRTCRARPPQRAKSQRGLLGGRRKSCATIAAARGVTGAVGLSRMQVGWPRLDRPTCRTALAARETDRGAARRSDGGHVVVAGVVDELLGQHADAAILLLSRSNRCSASTSCSRRAPSARRPRLHDAIAPTACVLRDGQEQHVATESLVPATRLVVREGDLVFADARVLGDTPTVDESHLVSGESEPQSRQAGDSIMRDCACSPVVRVRSRRRPGRRATARSRRRSPRRRRRDAAPAADRTHGAAAVHAEACLSRRSSSPSVALGVTLAMVVAPEEFPLVFTVFLYSGRGRAARLRVRGTR